MVTRASLTCAQPASVKNLDVAGGPSHSRGGLNPAGGWHPYGGGLLHWWNPHCFPCRAAPDDYYRKPLPRVCWPPYPPYYIWGPPEIHYPHGPGPRLQQVARGTSAGGP